MIKVNLTRLPEIDRETNEAYKQLRTNVMFCGDNIKTLMVTSTMPNEGKSEVSYFLAHSIAESKKRVLLLDGDIRKSMMATRFAPDKKEWGFQQWKDYCAKAVRERRYICAIDKRAFHRARQYVLVLGIE